LFLRDAFRILLFKSERVKSKTLFPFIFFIILLGTSCKKESISSPAIVGKWMNTAVYSDPAQGGYGWETVTRHEFVTFNPNEQFVFFTDIPAGGGQYAYNGASNDLLLNFEADQYGNTARAELRKVETMTETKLIVSFVSAINGMIYKTEYTRIN
jgi:hypothetical protein